MFLPVAESSRSGGVGQQDRSASSELRKAREKEGTARASDSYPLLGSAINKGQSAEKTVLESVLCG
jgi:hypothetical protein